MIIESNYILNLTLFNNSPYLVRCKCHIQFSYFVIIVMCSFLIFSRVGHNRNLCIIVFAFKKTSHLILTVFEEMSG
jgi:hypothetical protein